MNEMRTKKHSLPYAPSFTATLQNCWAIVKLRGDVVITNEHLLLALIEDKSVVKLLAVMRLDCDGIKQAVTSAIGHTTCTALDPNKTGLQALEPVLVAASDYARRVNAPEVNGAHALIALGHAQVSNANLILVRFGFEARKALQYLSQSRAGEPVSEAPRSVAYGVNVKAAGVANNRAYNVNASLVVSASSRNLSEEERQRGAMHRHPPSRSVSTIERSGYAMIKNEHSTSMLATVREIIDQYQPAPRMGSELRAVQASYSSSTLPPHHHTTAQPEPSSDAISIAYSTPVANRANSAPARTSQRPRFAVGEMPNRVAVPTLTQNFAAVLPKTLYLQKPQMVDISLPRDETLHLFAANEEAECFNSPRSVSHAITMTLNCPEGGLYIENVTSETQWVFDRPLFLQRQPFGRWSWRLVGAKRGSHKIQLTIDCCSIDEVGGTHCTRLYRQSMQIRVKAQSLIGRLF